MITNDYDMLKITWVITKWWWVWWLWGDRREVMTIVSPKSEGGPRMLTDRWNTGRLPCLQGLSILNSQFVRPKALVPSICRGWAWMQWLHVIPLWCITTGFKPTCKGARNVKTTWIYFLLHSKWLAQRDWNQTLQHELFCYPSSNSHWASSFKIYYSWYMSHKMSDCMLFYVATIDNSPSKGHLTNLGLETRLTTDTWEQQNIQEPQTTLAILDSKPLVFKVSKKLIEETRKENNQYCRIGSSWTNP